MAAIENLTATTLRNIIGDLELDHTLTSRDVINTKIARHAGRGHRPLGHQGQPGGAQEHHAAPGDPGLHGEADEGRAGAPRGHPPGRGREAQRQILVAEGEKESAILRAEAVEAGDDPRGRRARPRPS